MSTPRKENSPWIYFMFATGIENSYPTVQGGRVRMDEMEKCRHYDLWKKDFDLVQELGISYLRYGPPLHRTWLGPGRYDWSFADETYAELRRRDLTPITDLCHFGVPDWIENFQNPDFPGQFARYARDFALRYPWVQLYTPINEMYVCALFSAKYGRRREEFFPPYSPGREGERHRHRPGGAHWGVLHASSGTRRGHGGGGASRLAGRRGPGIQVNRPDESGGP